MKSKIALIGILTILMVLALLMVGQLANPSSPADSRTVQAANHLYQAGNYGEAIRIYEQLIAQGVEDSVVYYNLGNAYYMQGDLGRSILNLKRAAQLDPRDPAIEANLELAKSQANAVPEDDAPGPLPLLAGITSNRLTLDETAILALGLWFNLGLVLLVWRMSAPGALRRASRVVAIILVPFLLITSLSLAGRLYLESIQADGIVVAPVVALSSEPGVHFETELSLPTGTEVTMSEIQGNWVHLSVPGALIDGWVPLESVETIATAPIPGLTL